MRVPQYKLKVVDGHTFLSKVCQKLREIRGTGFDPLAMTLQVVCTNCGMCDASMHITATLHQHLYGSYPDTNLPHMP